MEMWYDKNNDIENKKSVFLMMAIIYFRKDGVL